MLRNGIIKLRNKHRNKKCFILANGPSIKDLDLSKLKNHIVISMNASPLLEEEHDFLARYYVVSDTRFLEVESKKAIAESKLKDRRVFCVFREEIKDLVEIKGKNNFYIPSISRDGFSKNLANGFYFGCTTTMLAIQLAYYLGCNETYLLGVDLNYAGKQARFYKEEVASPVDDNNSIQILNIRNARLLMEESDMELRLCSENSLLRPYVPFSRYDEVVDV